MCTLRAVCERNTAAWPGRVPPAHHDDLFAARTTATRCTWRRNRFPRPRISPDSSIRGLLYCAPVAITIARAGSRSRCPARLRTGGCRSRAASTLRAIIIFAPNFCACAMARAASSCPETPVGKAQIVLDLRARSRLPSGHRGLDHQNVQPFRGRVHRRRQTRRSGAHDDHIAHLRLIDGAVQSQAIRQLRESTDCAAPLRALQITTGISSSFTSKRSSSSCEVLSVSRST